MRKTLSMLLWSALALAACSDDDGDKGSLDASTPVLDAAPATGDGALGDAAALADAGPASPALDCFVSPTTYLELINACTDAEKIAKSPVLPLLGADGGLPPLP